jgi:hypothetical protein
MSRFKRSKSNDGHRYSVEYFSGGVPPPYDLGPIRTFEDASQELVNSARQGGDNHEASLTNVKALLDEALVQAERMERRAEIKRNLEHVFGLVRRTVETGRPPNEDISRWFFGRQAPETTSDDENAGWVRASDVERAAREPLPDKLRRYAAERQLEYRLFLDNGSYCAEIGDHRARGRSRDDAATKLARRLEIPVD